MRQDPYFKCGWYLCNKTMHKTDDSITVSVLLDSKESERKRFCCLDHVAQWAVHRENFPLEKRVTRKRR